MRFFLNLIYFLFPFQRTRSQLPTPKTQRLVDFRKKIRNFIVLFDIFGTPTWGIACVQSLWIGSPNPGTVDANSLWNYMISVYSGCSMPCHEFSPGGGFHRSNFDATMGILNIFCSSWYTPNPVVTGTGTSNFTSTVQHVSILY